MRRRIKPIVVYLFLGFLAVCLLYSHQKMQKAYEQQLTDAKTAAAVLFADAAVMILVFFCSGAVKIRALKGGHYFD